MAQDCSLSRTPDNQNGPVSEFDIRQRPFTALDFRPETRKISPSVPRDDNPMLAKKRIQGSVPQTKGDFLN